MTVAAVRREAVEAVVVFVGRLGGEVDEPLHLAHELRAQGELELLLRDHPLRDQDLTMELGAAEEAREQNP